MGPTFPYMTGGIFDIAAEAFIYGGVYGFCAGLLFGIVITLWLNKRLGPPREREE